MFKTTIAAAAAAVAFAPAAALPVLTSMSRPMQVGLAMTTPEQPLTFMLVTRVKLALLPTMSSRCFRRLR